MGLINGETQHPFRPKRMRSIFRSAASIAGVEKGYAQVFMGHKSDISDSYIEKPIATMELRYEMIEPYITIFSGDPEHEIREMKEQVVEYSERQDKAFDLMFDLRDENMALKAELEELSNQVTQTQKMFDIVMERLVWLEGLDDDRNEEEASKIRISRDRYEKLKEEAKNPTGNVSPS